MKKPIVSQPQLLIEPERQIDPRKLSAQEREAWLEQIMAPIRKHYEQITQPMVLAHAKTQRAKR